MGCGASNEQQNDGKSKDAGGKDTKTKDGTKYDQKEELPGKGKYLVDLGAAVMQSEDRKSGGTNTVVAYVDEKTDATVFVAFNSKSSKYNIRSLTDAEFTTLKDGCSVTFSFTAVYKSISTELGKGKCKITPRQEGAVALEVSVTSVKDPKNAQLLMIDLPPATGPALGLKHIAAPLSRMVQKKRQTVEEREKELKVSKMHSQNLITDASIAKHKETLDAITPHIVPLREEAARFSKASAELVAKIATVERKIRKLHSSKGKNALDGVYEDGGARTFQHLPDAEEHIPVSKPHDGLLVLDFLKDSLPLKEGEALEKLVAAPTDPNLKALIEKSKGVNIPEVMKAFQRIDDWDMSVFDLERLTGNNALFVTAYTMLYKLDLVRKLNINDKILRNFLNAVQSGYHPNPYHNSTHAADVAQINYFIMTKGGLIDKCKLSTAETFGAILAGVIHDYDHPGFNNNFHTRTNAYLSTLYNDRSILENHHLACVFEMLRLPKYNVLAGFTEEQYRDVRDTMTEMVLSTDMGLHGKIFSSFRRRLGECPEWHERKDDVRLALSMSIKMADISNCGRPKHLYIEWAKNIATEFYNQGDVEQKLCIPISPFMDRRKDKQEFPKGQISFMNFIVVPMFEAISEFLPPVECSLRHCTENKEYWQQQE